MSAIPANEARVDGCLPTAPPLIAADASAVKWDRTCDVLVVGFGGAGAAAAIAAKEGGASVIVAERFEGGGATAKSGGVVYAGGGTKQQKAVGYDDTPEDMFRYLRQETGDAISEATLRRFCDDSRGLIEWLESIGADFTSTAPPPKTSYPKDGIYLYYSGNEAVPSYAAQALPAPRGHRTRGSWLSGKAMFELLKARAAALGIDVMHQSAARRLVKSDAGDVLGAELWQLAPGSPEAQAHEKLMRRAEKWHDLAPRRADRWRAEALGIELSSAKPVLVRATRGVVLTTGGFIFNREMVAQHAPKFRRTMRLGATGCDGSGIRLGQSVGGATGRMEKVSAWRFINPPSPWPHGIVVNHEAQRFCNEQVYGAKLGVEMCERQDGRAWLVLDRKLRWSAIKETLFGGLWWFQSVPAFFLMLFAPRAKTPEQLAEKMGWPHNALRTTIDEYNAAIADKREDALGKADAMRKPLDTPPYFALNISADNRSFPCPSITLGGLKVDETSGAVLDGRGEIIPGLYAAGRAAVGIASNGYVSGLSIADCLWSGRRAGAASAASNVGRKPLKMSA
ncbi:MAG TPA: FAD-binding protein [Nevskiaceae bacterium]|nr:FAD-binding protein [Nevskiaceae bacterium]